MPAVTRNIKRSIRSIGNTRKITKAMELVAAAKMRKAVNAVLATRSYANAAWEIVKNLSARTSEEYHPLLQKRKEVKNVAVMLITSNRGLCAGFNREIVEQTADYIEKMKKQGAKNFEIILFGKKGRDIVSRYKQKAVAEFEKEEAAKGVAEISAASRLLVNDFLAKKYDQVVISYTDYFSAISQKPRIKTILPIEQKSSMLGEIGRAKEQAPQKEYEYLFEPSPDVVLDQMMYRLIELQIYQALLESNASEHSARMMAMRNASDAASDMIDDLTLAYNQARQQAITAELADIIGGRAAVE